MSKLKAIIFDFDGVIVDSERIHYQAFQSILPDSMHHSWEDYLETYVGYDDRDALREMFVRSGQPEPVEGLPVMIEKKAGAFRSLVMEGAVEPYPGVVAALRQLKADGIAMAICSGALLSDIEPVLDQLQITDLFDCIVAADHVQKSKPDPQCYSMAFEALANKYAITKSDVCAIEDTPTGILAAKGAGLKVVALPNTHSVEHLNKADLLLAAADDLTVDNLAAALVDC